MKKALFPVVMFVFMALIIGAALPALAERSPGVQYDDAVITAKVKAALAENDKYSTLKMVQVDTQKGEVTLTGKVSHKDEKEYAERVAKKVEGVKDVDNKLTVLPEK
jgi:hyperosmotically inducible protein